MLGQVSRGIAQDRFNGHHVVPIVAQGLDPKVVQTLLGHSELEMTELYLNDRGLSRNEWKRVEVPAGAESA